MSDEQEPASKTPEIDRMISSMRWYEKMVVVAHNSGHKSTADDYRHLADALRKEIKQALDAKKPHSS